MKEGVVLAGKYRLEGVLGRGGMGSVWRAHHLGLEAPIAVKLMDPAIMSTPGMLQRFHREAQAAAKLRSPHVVQIIDHGVDDATATPFIAMELLEGESLLDRLGRVRTLTPSQTARLVSDVCRALGRAHDAGIIHRDLKPANLFLVANDDQELTKVLDFGIAKSPLPLLGVDSTTSTGSILGTPLYMSPEQISGGKLVDARSDLWSLAVVTCECLTGRRPFSADSIGALTLIICTEPLPVPSRLGPVPDGFDAWFERAVARDPAARFQSAREFAEEFRKVCGVLPSEDAAYASRNSGPPELRGGDSERTSTTAKQWGRVAGAGASHAEPLAPTVDVNDARTADALSKSSSELSQPSARKAGALRVAAAVAVVAFLAGTLVMLLRGPGDDGALRLSPSSALPAAPDQREPGRAEPEEPGTRAPAAPVVAAQGQQSLGASAAPPVAPLAPPVSQLAPPAPPVSQLAPPARSASPAPAAPEAPRPVSPQMVRPPSNAVASVPLAPSAFSPPPVPAPPASTRVITIESVIDERR